MGVLQVADYDLVFIASRTLMNTITRCRVLLSPLHEIGMRQDVSDGERTTVVCVAYAAVHNTCGLNDKVLLPGIARALGLLGGLAIPIGVVFEDKSHFILRVCEGGVARRRRERVKVEADGMLIAEGLHSPYH